MYLADPRIYNRQTRDKKTIIFNKIYKKKFDYSAIKFKNNANLNAFSELRKQQ